MIRVYLNPTPLLSVDVSDTIYCDNSTVDITVTDDLLGVLGTKVYALTTTTSGSVLGVTASGEYPAGTSISNNLVNQTTQAQWIDYRFEARIKDPRGTNPSEYCDIGTDTTIRVYLNPTPLLSVDVSDTIYCDSSTVDITVLDEIGPVIGTSTKVYELTTTTSGGVLGITASGEYLAGTPISDFLVNQTSAVQWVDYQFEARISDDRSGHGGDDCGQGTDTTIRVYLNPSPFILVNVVPQDTICNEDNITFNVTNPNLPLGDWKYRLEINYGEHLTGQLPEDSIYSEINLPDALFNDDSVWYEASYKFTPIISPFGGGLNCQNSYDTTIYVRVNPTPAIRVIAEDSILCNGEPAEIRIHNPNVFVFGDWEYDLEVIPDPGMGGYRESDTALIETWISDPLINYDTVLHKVEYHFFPKRSYDGLLCAGGTDTVIVIWVNPTPEIRVSVSDTMICDTEPVTLNIRNPNDTVNGEWNYDLIIEADPGIDGIVSDTLERINLTEFNYTLTNSDTDTSVVRFRFHPRITDDDDQDCENGIDQTITVVVLPVPQINVTVYPGADTLLCNDEEVIFEMANPHSRNTGTWSYDLIIDAEPGIAGVSSDTISNITLTDTTFNLTNTDINRHRVTFQFIPKIVPDDGGITCENGSDTTIIIWLNPEPAIAVDVLDTIICNNQFVDFTITDVIGEVFGDKKYIVTTYYTYPNVEIYNGSVLRSPPISRDTASVNSIFQDSLVNNTDETQWIYYQFTPIIDDEMPGDNGLCTGSPLPLIQIYVQPTPKISLEGLTDTIYCDTANVFIDVKNQIVLGDPEFGWGKSVYKLEVSYNAGAIEGIISGDSDSVYADDNINDWLFNKSDTIQVIEYHLTARIMDTRPGHENEFCDHEFATDTTLRIFLNPYPRLNYELIQDEDILCFDDGFILNTDSIVTYTTSPLYYNLDIINYNPGIIDFVNADPTGGVDIQDSLDERDIRNTGLTVGSVLYKIRPYISEIGCLGKDTSFLFQLNPEPVMDVTRSDTAVCHNWGFELPIGSDIESTTGTMRYQLFTEGYDGTAMSNVAPDDNYDIDTLDQWSVLNSGSIIENVGYYFTPFIQDAKGASKHCWGDTIMRIVQVAPELIGDIFADTTDFGGWNITCFEDADGQINPNLKGGYYLQDYLFNWGTTNGSGLVPTDSAQYDLDIGTYYYNAIDVIGCEYGDSVTLRQPERMWIDTTITMAPCESQSKKGGSILLGPHGGTGDSLGHHYQYNWTKPWGLEMPDSSQNIDDGYAGLYTVEVWDMNGCLYFADELYIGFVDEINVGINKFDYGAYNIKCFGEDNGWAEISVTGGTPDFDLVVLDEQADTVYNDAVDQFGVDYRESVYNLSAGEYTFMVIDNNECLGDEVELFEEPDSIEIRWENEKAHSDTVDISCFGEGDGNILISITGGHTASLDNSFTWSGPDPDLIVNDSIQNNSNLDPGLYKVVIEDVNGWCTNSAEFTLIEPPEIQMWIDSINERNGWNITCAESADGYIDIGSGGGILNHHYNWQKEGNPLSDPDRDYQDLLSGGTYQLTITDSIGCMLDTFFILTEPNPLGLVDSIPPHNGFAIACAFDSTGEIYLSPLGGADSIQNSYLWSTSDGYISNDTAMNQEELPEGTYSVQVTDINGCTFDTLYTLLDPEPIVIDNLSSDSAYCAGTASGQINMAVSGGIPDYSYLWSDGQTEDSIQDLVAGVYTVIITDQNACEKIDSIQVFEADRFSVDLVVTTDYNGVPISCAGFSDGAISLQPLGGTEPFEYLWSNGATTKDLVDIPAGDYSVIIADKHDCRDTAQVVIGEPAPLEYSMQLHDPLCYNESTGRIELLVTGGTVFTLDDYRIFANELLTDGPYMENLPQGSYHIRIEDLNDCSIETDADLIHPDTLALSFDTEDAYCKDKPDGQLDLHVDGGVYPYLISWDRGLPDNEGSFDNVDWGAYVATVTDVNNCVTIDTAFVDYTHASCLVIPTAFSPNSDGYNDLWIIEGLELYPQAEIRIFDRWGVRVYYSGAAGDNPWDGSFTGRQLPVDSYHFIIDFNNGEDPEMGNVTIVR
ncbi:MAG: T9SS type B sorting domain-containing protein [Bacteroidota bacterium]